MAPLGITQVWPLTGQATYIHQGPPAQATNQAHEALQRETANRCTPSSQTKTKESSTL